MKPQTIIVMAVFFLTSALLLGGCSKKEVRASDVWARPSLKGNNSAVYLTITNTGDEDDRLLAVRGEVAEAIELHRTMMEGEVMKMVKQDFVPLPAGGEVALRPGDYHIMLIGLRQDLQVGEAFELVLRFEKAGEMVVRVQVKAP